VHAVKRVGEVGAGDLRKLAAADREPRRGKYTTWTAVAPDLVLTVLT
jgi:hypothetical protein